MSEEVLYEVRGPKTLYEMTAKELKEAVKTAKTAVIGFGATEDHASHLPLCCDTLQGTELIKRIAVKLTERGMPAVATFCIPFGVQTNAFERPDYMYGNICVSQDTYIRMVTDISLELVKTGFERLVFSLNHAENFAALNVVAKDLGDIHGIPVIVADLVPPMLDEWPKFLKNAKHQGHAGEDETACVMVVAPNLINLDGVVSYHPPEDKTPPVKDAGLFYYGGAVGIYTPVEEDLSPGYVGDPFDATVEEGEKCYELYADWTVDVVMKYWSKLK